MKKFYIYNWEIVKRTLKLTKILKICLLGIMKKNLYRSNENKVIAGVCSGLGEYFDLSPKIFRVAFIIGLLFGFFPSVVVYLIMWVLIEESPIKKSSTKSDSGTVVDVDPTEKVD
jgi:phage shock protein C